MSGWNILLVDDHPMVRAGIKSLLSGNPLIREVEEAEDADECFQKIEKNNYDLIIMDIKMPKKSGIDVTKEILKKYPSEKILAISMYDEQNFIVKMLQAGAKGYLLKNSSKEELIKAIQTIMEGENYFSSEVSSIMLAKYIHKEYPALQKKEYRSNIKLTKREAQIIKMIADEMTNSDIASDLNISVRTVDTHRRNLLQKLDVKNTAGLVRFALENDLLN